MNAWSITENSGRWRTTPVRSEPEPLLTIRESAISRLPVDNSIQVASPMELPLACTTLSCLLSQHFELLRDI